RQRRGLTRPPPEAGANQRGLCALARGSSARTAYHDNPGEVMKNREAGKVMDPARSATDSAQDAAAAQPTELAHATSAPSGPLRPLVLAMTGASGAPYAVRLLQVLSRSGREVHLVMSRA